MLLIKIVIIICVIVKLDGSFEGILFIGVVNWLVQWKLPLHVARLSVAHKSWVRVVSVPGQSWSRYQFSPLSHGQLGRDMYSTAEETSLPSSSCLNHFGHNKLASQDPWKPHQNLQIGVLFTNLPATILSNRSLIQLTFRKISWPTVCLVNVAGALLLSDKRCSLL